LRRKDIRRFRREASTLSRLRHPNIVRVLEVSKESEDLGYLMEHCSEGSIDGLVDRSDMADAVFSQVSIALSHLHTRSNRIVHRDIKPANVLRGDDGRFKISDFGLAVPLDSASTRVTSSNWFSYGFSPPEQLLDMKSVDERADIYSLGALMYSILTGSLVERLEEIPFEDLGFVYGNLLSMILVADPNRRPKSVDAVVEAWTIFQSYVGLRSPDSTEDATYVFGGCSYCGGLGYLYTDECGDAGGECLVCRESLSSHARPGGHGLVRYSRGFIQYSRESAHKQSGS